LEIKKINLSYLLSIGLALTFLATSLTAFLHPNDFKELIQNSFVFSKTLDFIPFFVTFIGINDLLIAILLVTKLLPKIAAWWATLWVLSVILVLLTQKEFSGLLDAIEHGAPLAIALYLSLHKDSP